MKPHWYEVLFTPGSGPGRERCVAKWPARLFCVVAHFPVTPGLGSSNLGVWNSSGENFFTENSDGLWPSGALVQCKD